MRLLDVIRSISVKAAARLATQRRSQFKCGDCEEMERCGRLPSDDCIERAVQTERDGDKSRSSLSRGYQATY